MDEKTIKVLLDEAQKNHRKARSLFERHDNSEDMHEMERWQAVVGWLTSKLPIEV